MTFTQQLLVISEMQYSKTPAYSPPEIAWYISDNNDPSVQSVPHGFLALQSFHLAPPR